MATVTYDHVTKKFGDVTAVNDLNIQVRDGEFLVALDVQAVAVRAALREALERNRNRALERKHRDGYRRKPVSKKEFRVWESQHAWGDE